MLKLLEVFNPPVEDRQKYLFCLDVTENTEAEHVQILQAVRDLYGLTRIYQWHDCGHDVGSPCSRRMAI